MTAIYLDALEQGTAEWVSTRLGVPTASEFKKIITSTGKLSSQRTGYMAKLLADWYFGEPVSDWQGNEWTDRGSALEQDAFDYYSFFTDSDVKKCGFIWRDESKEVGCSPDGLAGDDGLIELKCPAVHTHLMYLFQDRVPPEYYTQVQGQIWVSGRSFCDFMSYYPDMPPLVVRVAPDPILQDAFDQHLPKFLDEIREGREKLKAML